MRRFQRTIEDFDCEICGTFVTGDGYRNHCPTCFVSKHVDVFPGDRMAVCAGLMDVTDIALEHGELILTHRCRSCGHERRNRVASDDDVIRIIAMMKCIRRQTHTILDKK